MNEDVKTKRILGVETTGEWLKAYARKNGYNPYVGVATSVIARKIKLNWLDMRRTKKDENGSRIRVLTLHDRKATDEQVKQLEEILEKRAKYYGGIRVATMYNFKNAIAL